MKKNPLFLATLPIAALLALVPLGVQALAFDISSSVGASTTVGSASLSGSANGSAPSADAGSDGNVSVTGSVSGSITPIAIDRADVDGTANASATTISVPEAVRTQADLNAYASSAVRADKNIDGVVLSDSGVMVRYMQPAKLFGFIPVSVTVTTEVDSQGTVSVKYPWYRFLVAVGDKEELETVIQSRVDSALEAHASESGQAAASAAGSGLTGRTVATSTVMLDAKMKAQLLSEVRNVMKRAVEASVDAEAAASADAR
ncbi:hypothetical protein K8Q93_00045 [Candidatus Parcubacteria bacterium]|nr:hypothetical protein [Candidatus Parcubacteria bacterium]